MRQYARDRLLESDEGESRRRFHLEYFLGLAEGTQPELPGAKQADALARLEAEHDNVRAALDWCLGSEASVNQGLRLAMTLPVFWDAHGHRREGRGRLESLISAAREAGETTSLPHALRSAGFLAFRLSDFRATEALFRESLAASR